MSFVLKGGLGLDSSPSAKMDLFVEVDDEGEEVEVFKELLLETE